MGQRIIDAVSRRNMSRRVLFLGMFAIPISHIALEFEHTAAVGCPQECTGGKTCVAGVCRYVSARQRSWQLENPEISGATAAVPGMSIPHTVLMAGRTDVSSESRYTR
jgi:hypothetical protein